MKIRELRSIGLSRFLRYAVEGTVWTAIILGILATLAILTYQCATSRGPFRQYYSGKIVTKTIVLTETNEGSLFFHKLEIEEMNGTRLRITVPQELYDRAKVGMLIQRNAKGLQLLPNLDESSTSP